MGVLKWLGFDTKKTPNISKPREMVFRFLPDGQVVWFEQSGSEFMNNGYLGNHAIFTIQDWKSKKVASCPPILYEIKDDKEYKRYRMLLKDSTPESLLRSQDIKRKALEEVENNSNLISESEMLFSFNVSETKLIISSGPHR